MTLSTVEMREILASVSYKPDWWFSIVEDRWEGPHLVIEACIPDAYGVMKNVDLRIVSAIPPIRDEGGFHSWLMWRLGRVESHELREFYRVGGMVYDDPHRNVVS